MRPASNPVGSPESIEGCPNAALAEDVNHPAAIDELDRAASDYPDLFLGPSALRKDRRARGEELDLSSFSEASRARRRAH